MSESTHKIFNIIIAVAVSIGAWTFVVYNNDPMTEVKYKDVPIEFFGEDALANRGLGVSQVSTNSLDITLKQKRIDTNDITAEDISIIADVSDAAKGENGISLQISGPDGTQVAEAESRSISVEIEEADSIEKTIYVEYAEAPDQVEPVANKLTSTYATVIGAVSEVSRVDKVAALIPYNDSFEGTMNFTSGLTALDADGDPIDHLVIYPGEINFRAYPGVIKEVSLKVVTTDPDADKSDDDEETDDGYIRSYTAPETVIIKGAASVVEPLEQISTEYVNIDAMYEDQEVELTCILPDGIVFANDAAEPVMKVTVTRKSSEAH